VISEYWLPPGMSMSDAPGNVIPPPKDAIGHFFDGFEVHMVFRNSDGGQFYVLKDTRERVPGFFLADGKTWARRDEGQPAQGDWCDARRAIHEAGHAVICADEGIKVEYMTCLPFSGWNGTLYHGWCQFDYRLHELVKADPATQ
jgi:hypothetical protein